MIRSLKTALATAALALSLGAQALTLTPQAPTVSLAPGGQAVALFHVDFEGETFGLMALDLHFDFDPTLLAGDSASISFQLAGAGAPVLLDFGFEDLSNHANGASYSWALSGLAGVPELSGSGLLSIQLSDSFALQTAVPLQARLLMFTMDDVELNASATLSVVPLPVPEPASWALALAGGCLLIAVRRRSQ